MKNIQRTLIGLLLGLSALWLLAESAALPVTTGLFPWRTLLVQYSGLLGMGVMSAAMLLAVRPAWLEHRLHGLDKMYRLHKWLGIAGLVAALVVGDGSVVRSGRIEVEGIDYFLALRERAGGSAQGGAQHLLAEGVEHLENDHSH